VSQSENSAASITRIDALDGLRAAVMILGVFLHAAVAYLHAPIPGLLWLTREPSESWGFDILYWYLHGFRIPLFFLVAGFFAALLCDFRGPRAYILHRLNRIGIPLAGAILVILPITYFIWGLGLAEQGTVTWREVVRMSFHDPLLKDALLGLAHLWFLQYLLIYSLVYYLLRIGFPALISFPPRVRLLDTWWRLFPLAIAALFLLGLQPEIYTGFDNRWIPEPWGLAYYALFFVLGSRLHQVRERLNRLIPLGLPFIIASMVIFLAVFILLRWQMFGEIRTPGTDWTLAIAVTLYSWLAMWGFLGICLAGYKTISRRAHFVADSAYWIYLVHLPLVGLAQLLIAYAAHYGSFVVPSILGFTLSVSFTLSVALVSYRFGVRYGRIGNRLHGPKKRDHLL